VTEFLHRISNVYLATTMLFIITKEKDITSLSVSYHQYHQCPVQNFKGEGEARNTDHSVFLAWYLYIDLCLGQSMRPHWVMQSTTYYRLWINILCWKWPVCLQIVD